MAKSKLSIADGVLLIVIGILIICIFFGFVLPFLISANNTLLVVLGIILLVALISMFIIALLKLPRHGGVDSETNIDI